MKSSEDSNQRNYIILMNLMIGGFGIAFGWYILDVAMPLRSVLYHYDASLIENYSIPTVKTFVKIIGCFQVVASLFIWKWLSNSQVDTKWPIHYFARFGAFSIMFAGVCLLAL